jgi:hypothetical protein
MPIIPALGRLRQENHLSLGVGDKPGQHSEILFKKKKRFPPWGFALLHLIFMEKKQARWFGCPGLTHVEG